MNYLYKIIDIVLESEIDIPFLNLKFRKELKQDEKCYISILNRGYSNSEFQTYPITAEEKYLLKYKDCFVLCDRKWRKVTIHNGVGSYFEILLLYVFRNYAVQNHIIQFHSSLISHQNSGIMFLGPSGIGKTTQAELWNQYRDALIINGDIVFVQETEKNFLGWGTPWHGSSSYCENTSVPLRAMVVLKQAKENSIRELVGFEKVSEVSNHVFYPQWLENGMELCLETLDHLLTAIPVYELSCRPDEDAVRMTEETIFGT